MITDFIFVPRLRQNINYNHKDSSVVFIYASLLLLFLSLGIIVAFVVQDSLFHRKLVFCY